MSAHETSHPGVIEAYLRQSALALARISRKHFGIEGRAPKLRIPVPVTADQVSAFFVEYQSRIRPLGLSEAKVLPPPSDDQARTFLWTYHSPDRVLNDLVRLAMYADEIIVVDPFSAHVSNRPFRPGIAGPLNRPEAWVTACANWALLMCALEPWVEAGIVVVIPDVNSFIENHPPFVQLAMDAANRGILDLTPTPDSIQEMMENLVLSAPSDKEVEGLVQAASPDMTQADRDVVVAALQRFRSDNPTRYSYPQRAGEIVVHGSGQNVFEAAWIADTTGSFVAARGREDRRLFRQLSRGGDKDRHDALVTAFAAVKLPMLNNVTLDTALDIRRTGRISSFRTYLREVWEATANPDEAKDGASQQALADRMTAEYDAARGEWEDIYKQLGLKGAGALAAAIQSGQIVQGGLVPTALVGATWIANTYRSAVREFQRTPAALLVELENETGNIGRRLASVFEHLAK